MRAVVLVALVAAMGCGKRPQEQDVGNPGPAVAQASGPSVQRAPAESKLTSYPQLFSATDSAVSALWLAGERRRIESFDNQGNALAGTRQGLQKELIESLAGKAVDWRLPVAAVTEKGEVVLEPLRAAEQVPDPADNHTATFLGVRLVRPAYSIFNDNDRAKLPWSGTRDELKSLTTGSTVRVRGTVLRVETNGGIYILSEKPYKVRSDSTYWFVIEKPIITSP